MVPHCRACGGRKRRPMQHLSRSVLWLCTLSMLFAMLQAPWSECGLTEAARLLSKGAGWARASFLCEVCSYRSDRPVSSSPRLSSLAFFIILAARCAIAPLSDPMVGGAA